MNITHGELFVIAWLVRTVGALVLLLALLTALIHLVRGIARRTQTLGYLWRAAWIYARADHNERARLRAANKRAMLHVPGLREGEDR